MALTGSLNGAWDDGVIQAMTEMRNDVQGMTYTGLDRTNMATDSAVVTIATSAPGGTPKTGELWNDTSTPAAGASTAPSVRGRVYNGTEWIGYPVYYATTAPTTTETGLLWYDQTLELLRMYRRSTEDGEKTGTGIAGWHPLEEGYQLWTNKSGGTVSANRVVVWDGTVERGFTTTTLDKNPRVIGVTLESIANDATGVICTVGSGALVDIYCDVGPGSIATGDAIGTGPVAGEARTLGSIIADPNATASIQNAVGYPFGAFAVARDAIASDGVVPCKMLGFVGNGARVTVVASAVATFAGTMADAEWDGAFNEIDLVAELVSSKHSPMLGAFVMFTGRFQSSVTGFVTASLILAKNQTSGVAEILVNQGAGAGSDYPMYGNGIYVPTTDGTPFQTKGNKLQWKGTKSSVTMTAAELRITGYIH